MQYFLQNNLNSIILIVLSVGVNSALNFYGLFKTKYQLKDKRLDGGLLLNDGRSLFGQSTTLNGLLLCLVISFILYITTKNNFITISPLLVYIGHMVGSFIKRRFGRSDGEFLLIIDHGDSIIMLGIIAFKFYEYSFYDVIVAIIAVLAIQPLLTFIAYKLKLRKNPL